MTKKHTTHARKRSAAAEPSPAEVQAIFALLGEGSTLAAEQHARTLTLSYPRHGLGWKLLGALLTQQNRPAEALPVMQQAAALLPHDAEVHCNLGLVLQGQGLLALAERHLDQARTLRPSLSDVHYNLGLVYEKQKRFAEAADSYRQTIALEPSYAEAYCNLGAALLELADYRAAEQALRQALQLHPDLAEAYHNLGNVLSKVQRWEEAEHCYRHALQRHPTYAAAHNNLGNVLAVQGRVSEAETCYRHAITAQPDDADAYNNLGNQLKDAGHLANANLCYRQAVKLDPEFWVARHNSLFCQMYSHAVPPAETFAEHQRYGQQIAARVAGKVRQHLPPSSPLTRPLRIGFVSADLRRHAVTYFLDPLLVELKTQGFALFAYSNALPSSHDSMTQRIQSHVQGWRDVAALSDDALSAQIAADGIDILIDLSGHTAGNRLPVFAQKPAPVQASWLGYPATTGVPGMDWRITDPYAEPQGLTEHLNTERLWRLPDIFCCYQPSPNSPTPLDGLPCHVLTPAERIQGLPPELAERADPNQPVVTLGSFNNFAKVTPPVIALWSQILSQLPQARLLLEIAGIQDPVFAADVRQRFVEAGARPEQIHLVPRKPEHQYALYRQLDLALDPFPCVGGTTSFDSLWMGVPFVTLAGEWFTSRMGVTLLSNLGLEDLIVPTPAAYAEKVIALVNNLPQLQAHRQGLRAKMQASPLMDAPRFASHFGQALRGMWADWCQSTFLESAL